jgi:hypothetical protein
LTFIDAIMSTLIARLQAVQEGQGIVIDDADALVAAQPAVQISNWVQESSVRSVFDAAKGWGRLYTMVVRRVDGDLILFYRYCTVMQQLAAGMHPYTSHMHEQQ